MTLKRANNYFNLGQQELQEWKGGKAQFVIELICEAQAIIKDLILKGFEISEPQKPKQLKFRRWIYGEPNSEKEKIHRINSIQVRPRFIRKTKRKNTERIH